MLALLCKEKVEGDGRNDHLALALDSWEYTSCMVQPREDGGNMMENDWIKSMQRRKTRFQLLGKSFEEAQEKPVINERLLIGTHEEVKKAKQISKRL